MTFITLRDFRNICENNETIMNLYDYTNDHILSVIRARDESEYDSYIVRSWFIEKEQGMFVGLYEKW